MRTAGAITAGLRMSGLQNFQGSVLDILSVKRTVVKRMNVNKSIFLYPKDILLYPKSYLPNVVNMRYTFILHFLNSIKRRKHVDKAHKKISKLKFVMLKIELT